jgi:hypothetical protein
MAISTVLVDPVAQTFIIDDSLFTRGAFLSSVDLFFKTKPSVNVPITISIVSTLNGYPTGKTLDYSIVTLFPSDVNVSDNPQYLDSTARTRFTFAAPVYINPGILYAIIIQTNISGYQLWLAQQEDIPIASSVKATPSSPTPTALSKISKSPYVGTFFESQNGITYTADLTKDLMFVVNRCSFSTAATPSINFVVPYGLPETKNIEANVSVPALANVTYDELNLSTTHFIPTTTNISYTYRTLRSSDTALDAAISVSPGEYGTPLPQNLLLNDNRGQRVLDANTNTSFYLTATLSTGDEKLSPILSDDGTRLYTVKYAINNMGISNSDIIIANTGTNYFSGGSTTFVSPDIVVSAPDVPGGQQAYVTANVFNGNIVSVYVTTEGSGYTITPTITIATNTSTTQANVIVAGETSQTGGNGKARYQTFPVTLAEGNDSGDLRVYFTAYRPVQSDIHVYYKLLSRDDTQRFSDGYWQKMTIVGGADTYASVYGEVFEYQAAPGINGLANNFVSYVSSVNGAVYNDFYQYAIKIVMSSSDSTRSPLLTDMRVIALPEGTGA